MDEFLKQPDFNIFSRTLNNGGPKMITDPKKYPYPDYPLRDIEGDKTKIDVHGGFRDYFQIAAKQEREYIRMQRQIL